jgi:hypothetical protein
MHGEKLSLRFDTSQSLDAASVHLEQTSVLPGERPLRKAKSAPAFPFFAAQEVIAFLQVFASARRRVSRFG